MSQVSGLGYFYGSCCVVLCFHIFFQHRTARASRASLQYNCVWLFVLNSCCCTFTQLRSSFDIHHGFVSRQRGLVQWEQKKIRERTGLDIFLFLSSKSIPGFFIKPIHQYHCSHQDLVVPIPSSVVTHVRGGITFFTSDETHTLVNTHIRSNKDS